MIWQSELNEKQEDHDKADGRRQEVDFSDKLVYIERSDL